MIRRKIHNRIIRILELILEKSNFLSKSYTKFFTKMTLNEFKMADLSKEANVLVIGCGPVPHTLTILGEKTNWKITGIDKDKKAVEKAKIVISKYNLDNKIKVKNEDGLKVDLSDYDLIVIAHGVEPKEKILERVMKDKPNGANVLYRTTWEVLDIFYGKEWLPDQTIIKKVYYRPDLIKSIILDSERT